MAKNYVNNTDANVDVIVDSATQEVIGLRNRKTGDESVFPRTDVDGSLVGADGQVFKPAPAFNYGLVFAGDSRKQQNYDQTATSITGRPRSMTLANAIIGQRFDFINNAGVNGQTAAQLLARISTSNLGAGFGALGNGGSAVTTSPGVNFDNAQYVVVNIGTNDIFGNSATAADTFAITSQIFDYVLKSGKTLIAESVIAPNSALSGYSVAKVAELIKYNALIKAYCESHNSSYFVDTFSAIVSPTSSSVETAANDLRDGTNHENNVGGYKEAKVLAETLKLLAPPRNSILPASNAATSALDSSITQLNVNPLLTGSASITATGYSGTTAGSQLANANFVRGGGSPTAVLSAVSRADGYGQDIQFECTFGADNNTLELRMPSYHAQAVVGGKYIAVADVNVTGPSGAALQASDNFKGCQLYIQYNDGTTNYFTYDMAVQSEDKAYFENLSMVMRTLPITIPSGGTPTTFRVNFTIYGNGSGGCRVKIGRIGLIRVA